MEMIRVDVVHNTTNYGRDALALMMLKISEENQKV